MLKRIHYSLLAGAAYLASTKGADASTLEKLTEASTGAADLISGAGGYSVLAVGSGIGIFAALRSGSVIAICSVLGIIIAAVFGFDMLGERFNIGAG